MGLRGRNPQLLGCSAARQQTRDFMSTSGTLRRVNNPFGFTRQTHLYDIMPRAVRSGPSCLCIVGVVVSACERRSVGNNSGVRGMQPAQLRHNQKPPERYG